MRADVDHDHSHELSDLRRRDADAVAEREHGVDEIACDALRLRARLDGLAVAFQVRMRIEEDLARRH